MALKVCSQAESLVPLGATDGCERLEHLLWTPGPKESESTLLCHLAAIT